MDMTVKELRLRPMDSSDPARPVPYEAKRNLFIPGSLTVIDENFPGYESIVKDFRISEGDVIYLQFKKSKKLLLEG